MNRFSRRAMLKLMGLGAASTAWAACAPSATPEPAAPVGDQEMTLSFWWPGCDAECEPAFVNNWTAKYTAQHPNVKFQMAGPPWDEYWTKLPLNIAGGSGPDLYFFHTNWSQQFVDSGLIEAWPEAAVPEIKQLVDHVDTNVINGKLYFYDTGLGTDSVFYNQEMWQAAGLTEADIPKSWAQLVEIAKELTVYDAAGEVERAGFNWLHDDVRWTWVMLKYQHGEFLFSQDGRRALFNTEGARSAAQMILDWEFKDKIGSSNLPGSLDSFASGLTATVFGGGWMADWLDTNHPEIEYGVFVLPTLDGQLPPAYDAAFGGGSPGVNPQAAPERKQVAFDFIRAATTDPELMTAVAMGGYAPVLKSIQSDPAVIGHPMVKAQLDQIERCIYYGTPPPAWENTLNVFTDPVLTAFTGDMDQALAEAQQAADEALSEPDTVYWGFQERLYAHAGEMHEPALMA